jgi:hypothetical protein
MTAPIFTSMSAGKAEQESKEKHGVWDPMPELTITLPYVHSRVNSTPTHLTRDPLPESTLILCQSRLYPPIGDFGFCLRILPSPEREYDVERGKGGLASGRCFLTGGNEWNSFGKDDFWNRAFPTAITSPSLCTDVQTNTFSCGLSLLLISVEHIMSSLFFRFPFYTK